MNPFERPMPVNPPQKAMRGVSLIEMMISLTIGLIIIAGIGYAFLASRQSFRTQDVLARMQEGARTAFETMARDIRMVGFNGCASATTNITVQASLQNNWYTNLVTPLQGYENTNETSIAPSTGSNSAFPSGVTGVTGKVLQGDVLTVLHADSSNQSFVSSLAGGNTQIQLARAANPVLSTGEVLMAVDCNTAGTAKVDIFTCSANCNTSLITAGSALATTTAGSYIFPVYAATYFISNNNIINGTNNNNTTDTEPRLYRAWLKSDGTLASPPDELIEGVQDMQLAYAIDTDSVVADTTVECYARGNLDGSPPSCQGQVAVDWAHVLGVRISLLMSSRQSEQGITTKAQTYSLDMNANGNVTDTGETVTANDQLLRKVFTTTIAVKNRL